MIDVERLIAYASDYGVNVSRETGEKLDLFAQLLIEWNQKLNLTAVTDAEGVLIKHLVDSLTVATQLPSHPFDLLDVGSGAGFPGIPLAILRPDIRVTLLESLQKKAKYLEQVCQSLGLSVRVLNTRAELAGKEPTLRESFDVVTARAVAAMPTLCEYCLPLVRVGGVFLAMKGPDGEAEAAQAKNAIALLGGAPCKCQTLQLPMRSYPNQSTRKLLTVQKKSATADKYPRPSAKISKQPL